MDMLDLEEHVVFDCYCDWGIFIENVRENGWALSKLTKEVEKCKDKKELRHLVNQFI